ncbi:MAG: type I methionyl aminopeptidase [Lentisphaerales bacterium]|nr:MAG: type I methionyl aminopeptidase [Lentisphaerales bacterium]
MIIVKSTEEIEKMRASGRIAGDVRSRLASRVAPGITTKELDEYAEGLIDEAGGESAFYGYKGFPGHVCLSINEEVVHGIPGKRRIKLGDVVSIDVGVRYGGYVGDTATTVMVGVVDLDIMRLVATGEAALKAAVELAQAGRHLSDVSHAIETAALEEGFSVVREFVGHGIGRDMHEDPQIPNFGKPGKGPVLKPGMTLALEPMINMGVDRIEIMADGWTVLTADRRPSVHFEHTVAVRKSGKAEILT